MKDIILNPHSTIKDAINALNKGAIKIAIVLDKNDNFLGTISDGDIRRAILKGYSLEDEINNIYNKKAVTASVNTPKEKLISLCVENSIYQIPIIEHNKLVDIAILDELLKPKEYQNKVVLMVGGLGSRLRPLTDDIPKPLLKVGDKPILETIIENFKKYGFKNFIFCLNYKSDMIKEYFKDGSKFGVNIEYVLENKRMGTAGALSLIQKPKEPFFVMNGDLLTNINFESMLEYHIQNNSIATMGVREYDFQVPYGVVNMKDNKIMSIEEKPIHKFFVSGGIYLLDPQVLDIIPQQFYDMPNLFEELIKQNKNVISFPIQEYWLDIGRIEEYEKAQIEYERIFDV